MVILTFDQTPGLAMNVDGEKLTQLTVGSLTSGSVIWASPFVPRALKTSSFMLIFTGSRLLFISCSDRVSLVPGGIDKSRKTGEVVKLIPSFAAVAACAASGVATITALTIAALRYQRIRVRPLLTWEIFAMLAA